MLEVKNLEKSYKDKKILNRLSFCAFEGEVTQIVGANGSGKTTLFRLVCNLLKPDDGTILLNGVTITNQDIGYLCEERSLYTDCTILQHAEMIMRLNCNFVDYEVLFDWLSYLKIKEYMNQKISRLSKGNRQKAALLLCLIKNPNILILDEPYTALDRDNVELLNKIIARLKTQGKIILLSSHQYADNYPCDHHLFLKDGKITLDIAKMKLDNHQSKMVRLTAKDDAILPFDFLNQAKEYGGKLNVLCENEASAKNLVSRLIKLDGINYCAYESVQMRDLWEEQQ